MPNSTSPIISGSIVITHGTQMMHLLPEKAVWLPATRTLAVADLHLGKGNAFRAAGLPIPSGSSAKDLNRVSQLADCLEAARIVVLGDLIHAKTSHQQELTDVVSRWRKKNSYLDVLLVRGNHDIRSGRVPGEWNFQEVEEPFEDHGILFSHHPRCGEAAAVICGHVHPVYCLKDFDGASVRVPCFVLSEDHCLTLPSFGSLTGGHSVPQKPGQRIFITSGKNVICLNRH